MKPVVKYRKLSEEAEIDLVELFYLLLAQWRPVIVTMVLIGMLAVPAVYYKDMRAYKIQVAEQQNAVVAQGQSDSSGTTDAIMGLLSAEEYNVRYAASLYKANVKKKDQRENMPIYSLDPKSVHVLRFNIIGRSKGDPEEVLAISSVRDYLCSRSAYEKYNKVYGLKQSSYLRGLITAEQNQATAEIGAASITLDCIYLNDDQVPGLVKATGALLKDAADFGIDLKIASTTDIEYYDQDLENRQNAFNTEIEKGDLDVANLLATFADAQKSSFCLMIEEGLEEQISGDMADQQSVSSNDTQSDTHAGAVVSALAPVITKSYIAKYFGFGAIAGLFLYALVLFLVQTFQSRVIRNDQMADILEVRDLGEIWTDSEKEQNTFFFDRKLWRKLHKIEEDETAQIKTIVAKILALTGDESHIKFFCSPVNVKSAQAEALRNALPSAVIINDSSALSDSDAVVIIAESLSTTNKEVDLIASACGDLSVKILGSIMLC